MSSSSPSFLAAAAVFVTLLAAAAPACSSKTADTTCDSTKCAPGNKCLPLGTETKCRKTCSSNTDPTASCPAGYTCVAGGVVEPFCIKDDTGDPPAGKGQWGAPCNAAGGLDSNPDCDSAHNFYCYGTSPTDGTSYCTRFQCQTDRNCAAGFWCATVNTQPNVATAARTVGDTQTVCLKRSYCSTCQADLDCPPLNGHAQHCVSDDNNNSFCSPECSTTDNCNTEAKCVDFGDYKACYPRAGACVGDGSLCSPCRSDKDCGDDGACVKGQYTTEQSCAKKSKIPCTGKGVQQGVDQDCPGKPAGATGIIACLGGTDFSQVPANYCHGVFEVGGQPSDVGCYTPNR